MKITYEFATLEEEAAYLQAREEEHRELKRGRAALSALEAIRREVFRPARKHGYSDPDVQRMFAPRESGNAGEQLYPVVRWEPLEAIKEDDLTPEGIVGELESLYTEVVLSCTDQEDTLEF